MTCFCLRDYTTLPKTELPLRCWVCVCTAPHSALSPALAAQVPSAAARSQAPRAATAAVSAPGARLLGSKKLLWAPLSRAPLKGIEGHIRARHHKLCFGSIVDFGISD